MAWGGGVSWEEFLQTGNVYDVSQKALTASNPKWQYDQTEQGFWIMKKKAVRRMKLDGKEHAWGVLYADVQELNVPMLEAQLRYYNKQGERVFEQPIVLTQGVNKISLNPEIPVSEIGFFLPDAAGTFLSFASVQIREKELLSDPKKFISTFFFVYALYLLLYAAVGMLLRHRNTAVSGKLRSTEKNVSLPGTLLGYLFDRATQKRPVYGSRHFHRRLLFCLLFLWTIAARLLGWDADGQMYRWHYLICAVLLTALGMFCREGEQKKVTWNTPVAWLWVLLWCGVNISDFFNRAEIHFAGYVMLLAAGFFIYQWAQMEKGALVLEEMRGALEIVFFLSAAVCLFFRPKLLAVQYNGIFKNPGESAMFTLLMFVTFAVEMEQRRRISDAAGMALSAYFVLRAEETAGMVGLLILVLLCLVRILQKKTMWRIWLRKQKKTAGLMLLVAAVLTGTLYIGTKAIPQKTGLAWTYRGEEKLSGKSEQILADLTAYDPTLTEGVVRRDEIEQNVIWKQYLRKINLFGNGKQVKVFREEAKASNGYLEMAYRYGIFILVPFVLYQVAALKEGIACFAGKSLKKQRRQQGAERFWLLGILVIYILFSISGNAQMMLSHPLWMCVYLVPGYFFTDQNDTDSFSGSLAK